MFRKLILALTLVLSLGFVWAQGAETFESLTIPSNRYSDGTFVGDEGFTWTFAQAREAADNPIDGKGITFRNAASGYLEATIPGGIGNLSFQCRKAFTGGTTRTLEVLVNGTSVYTTPPFDSTVQTFNHDINQAGNVTIKFKPEGTSAQVTLDNIIWTGYSGGNTPSISVSGTLNPFSTYVGTPSQSQSYTLSGSNLSANISVTAPTGYELSTDNTAFTSTLSLASNYSGLVYVRLTGAATGTFTGNITHSSGTTTGANMEVTGEVMAATPTIFVDGTLNDFATYEGTPSVAQSYQLSGVFLTGNISVTAPTGYSISSDNTTFSSSLSLAPAYNGPVYVRLDGTTQGTFNGNIDHNSTGATQVQLPVQGSVNAPATPTIFMEEEFLYTSGTTLVSNGWIAHSGAGTNSPLVHTEGLSYTGYPLTAGLAGVTLGNGEDVQKAFPGGAITEGSVYTSFLINVTSASTGNGDYTFHFMPQGANSTDFKGKIFVSKNTDDQLRFGLTKSSAATAADWTGYDYALNTTYLVVMKYEFVPGTANDIVTAWINPTIGNTEPTPLLSAAVTETDISATNGISAVAIRQSSSTPIAIFDGIRVTNDWAKLFTTEALPSPVLHTSGELDFLYCIAGGAPSEEVTSYALYGENLLGTISVTAPTNFEIATTAAGPWQSSLSLSADFNGLVYVRLNAANADTYVGNILHNSTGAAEVSVRVEGEAIAPTVTWNNSVSELNFEAEVNSGDSILSYTLSATGANADLALTLSGDAFSMRAGTTGDWVNSLTLPYNFNGSIYVKMPTTATGSFQGSIMHSTLNAAYMYVTLSGSVTPPGGATYATDLFFSEYIEGSSNNKALEIFNGTGVTVDLSDYKVELYANGAATPTNTATLSGTLAHGSVYVLANSQANADIQAVKDISSPVCNFNGDDAVALIKIGTDVDTYVDIFGCIGERPSGAWTDGDHSTADKTLVRKSTVTQGITVNPTTGFPTLAAEWDVYPQDTTTFLGSHTFASGTQVAEAPVISPAGGLQSGPVNVSMSSSTPGAVIHYTLDGTTPDQNSTVYTAPFAVSTDTTVKAIAYATGYDPSPVTSVTYSYPVQVANIAALRAKPIGAGNYYQLTGEAVLTFQQSTRNQKYIQDATAAIVIDDNAGVITTTYNLYDGITGIVGTLGYFSGLLQFTPALDPGQATSSGNVVTPEVRTLTSLTSNDQAKLIRVCSATLDATNVNFGTTAENIDVTDTSGTITLRTFPSTDYSGTPIPTDPVDLICLVGQYNTTIQVSPRFLADFLPATTPLPEPVISPAGGLQFGPVTVSISSSTPGATIYYTVDGTTPSQNSTVYTAPFVISTETTVKAFAFATGYMPSPVASATYTFPTQVANIAALRAMPIGISNYYHLTGEAVLTFQQSQRNQKYIQDATAAIVIDDQPGVITTTYNLYDGITGIVGTLSQYNNLLQFVPALDPGQATSSGNVVTPEVRTLASLTSDDQGKLIKVRSVTLAATGNFGTGAQNINISDASGSAVMRTFPNTDYSGTPIPTDPVDVICLAGQFGSTMQISPRFLADFLPATTQLPAPVVQIVESNGAVTLSWEAVTGAVNYRIERSSDPYTGYVQIGITSTTSYIDAATGAKQFYRVIAE